VRPLRWWLRAPWPRQRVGSIAAMRASALSMPCRTCSFSNRSTRSPWSSRNSSRCASTSTRPRCDEPSSSTTRRASITRPATPLSACGEGPGVRSSAAKRRARAGLGIARPADTPLRLRRGGSLGAARQEEGARAWAFSRSQARCDEMMRPNVRGVTKYAQPAVHRDGLVACLRPDRSLTVAVLNPSAHAAGLVTQGDTRANVRCPRPRPRNVHDGPRYRSLTPRPESGCTPTARRTCRAPKDRARLQSRAATHSHESVE